MLSCYNPVESRIISQSNRIIQLIIFCDCDPPPADPTPVTPSPPTKSLGFGGFESSRLLILRGGNSHVR